jgi:hypothetical protein
VRLVMFSPRERELERGWPGRLDGDRVVHLAAQTVESFFTGGGTAREHDEFALDEVVLRAPVLRPPSIRVFSEPRVFTFGNTASIFGPDGFVPWPAGAKSVEARWCVGAVVGAEAAIAGFTLVNDWHCDLPPPKDGDFGFSFGPWIVTEDEYAPEFAWEDALRHAARNTHLRAGEILVSAPVHVEAVERGAETSYSHDVLGTLRSVVA